MALEFLHGAGDIPEFVDFLWDKGYVLSHRCGPRRGMILDRQDTVWALEEDLHTSWGAYVIEDASRQPILYLDSCGPQAHPSKLGRQGRLAGRIAFCGEKEPAGEQLLRLIRNYFRRTYAFRRYNGEARMSCHFGPHYQAMEADFFAEPRAEFLCTGYLQVLCAPGQAEAAEAARLLDRPEIRNAQVLVRPYWADHGLEQLCAPFLYDTAVCDLDACAAMVVRLAGTAPSVRIRRDNHVIEIANQTSADARAGYARLMLARPWIPFGS